MKAVIQRAARAQVTVDDKLVSKIHKGFVVLLGIEAGDSEKDADYLAGKIKDLRIFEDKDGKMNLALGDVEGEVLVISQFTLAADCRKGRRPSFDKAARPAEAERLYEYFAERLKGEGIKVAAGRFGAYMQVELVNDGPVTIILDSKID